MQSSIYCRLSFLGGGVKKLRLKVGVMGTTGVIINFGGYPFDDSKSFNKKGFSIFLLD